MGYPVDLSVSSPNDSVARVNGNGQKIGPAIILKVMAGDKVSVATNYYYNTTSTGTGQALTATDVINSQAAGLVSMTGGAHGSYTDLINPTNPLTGALNTFINTKDGTPTGKPNAFLNWMLLDDQFNYVSGSSGALQVGDAGQKSGGGLQTPLGMPQIPMTKSGYLYIYVSNATPSWHVFFDNLNATTYSGPMLEETHYYPFGLTMQGISDKALKTQYAQNKYRYNGKELQNQEFSDGSGLEEYDYGARMQDPQLGVWHNVDPKSDSMRRYSPYVYAFDNPLRFIDRDGMSPNTIIGTDGKRVDYTTNTDGTLSWSANASEDTKRVGNEMAKTQEGMTELNAMRDDKTQITIKIDSKVVQEGTSFERARTDFGEDAKGNPTATITIHEGSLNAQKGLVGNRGFIPVGDKKYANSLVTTNDMIGSEGVHEGTHITDPGSNNVGGGTKTLNEREVQPNLNQQKHLDEIIKHKHIRLMP